MKKRKNPYRLTDNTFPEKGCYSISNSMLCYNTHTNELDFFPGNKDSSNFIVTYITAFNFAFTNTINNLKNLETNIWYEINPFNSKEIILLFIKRKKMFKIFYEIKFVINGKFHSFLWENFPKILLPLPQNKQFVVNDAKLINIMLWILLWQSNFNPSVFNEPKNILNIRL